MYPCLDSCTVSCVAMSGIENNTSQRETVVEEVHPSFIFIIPSSLKISQKKNCLCVFQMCVRLNNVRTMKNFLSTLVETAVQNALDPGPGVDGTVMAVADFSNPGPSFAIDGQGNSEPTTSGLLTGCMQYLHG